MRAPEVSDVTNTSVSLSWSVPEMAGGNLDLYQVSFKLGNREEEIVNVTYTGKS